MRISNFMLWDLAYAELYFSEKYWPDFTGRDLDDALLAYTSRSRRFGGSTGVVSSSKSQPSVVKSGAAQQ
jgi:undecaprenyl diphosphate synthase